MFKRNHHFFWQLLILTIQEIGDCILGKGRRYRFVPIRGPNNLCRFTFKDKLNLALFAVAVCLVKVGRGGDFLFPHCSGLVCTLAEVP